MLSGHSAVTELFYPGRFLNMWKIIKNTAMPREIKCPSANRNGEYRFLLGIFQLYAKWMVKIRLAFSFEIRYILIRRELVRYVAKTIYQQLSPCC